MTAQAGIAIHHLTTRDIIKSYLNSQKKIHKAYSLRKLAALIQLSPSRLSEILNKKGTLSGKNVEDVSKGLNLSSIDSMYLKLLVESENARSPNSRKRLKNRALSFRHTYLYKQLKVETFQKITGFLDLAILEILRLNGVNQDPLSIAEQFHVHVNTVKESLVRLEQLDLLQRCDSGVLIPTSDYNRIGDQMASDAIKSFHKKIISKGLESLNNEPLEARNFRSSIFAVEEAKLPILQEKIKSFINQITESFDDPVRNDRIYAINVQFFPLSKNIRE